MKILGIETSCDETAAAVVETSSDNSHVTLLSNSISTSMNLHAKTGGIIPEIAARNQSKYIIPVIYDALTQAQISFKRGQAPDIDAIAITYGPGLIGSLLVGVETAKTLSWIWDKPLIPVNHLFGHIYANWVETPTQSYSPILFPLIALIVSGGHTDLVLMKSHQDISWLGGTRDDAAGEAFDKVGRLLGFPYPAGPAIEEAAKLGDKKAYTFPRPLLYDKAFDFSFSGLKSAVLRQTEKLSDIPKEKNSLAFATQDAIIEVLVKKTLSAAQKHNAKSIIISGGVAANQTLRDAFKEALHKEDRTISFFVPERKLCTDNAAMIASAAFFKKTEVSSWKDLTANPELYFD
ncbi:MAG TPA: tRNA (adenosine(37)-N6)-threonylcarbamoyltransferase complex transferase subunit TsaD [Patescibacteria group bacterium]|nr:tRNA (adenosine(37)-N6)-threonylcarbamoyltransferase complex transferase subunit TsaD [Patescibacteria group bacterium]